MEGVKIRRDVQNHRFQFKDYFKGFEKCPAVRAIFGVKTDDVLDELEIEFSSRRGGYMGVNGEDGCLIINVQHLKNSDERTLYLDVVHELVHVKQFRDGKNLFDPNYEAKFEQSSKDAHKLGINLEVALFLSKDAESELIAFLEFLAVLRLYYIAYLNHQIKNSYNQ